MSLQLECIELNKICKTVQTKWTALNWSIMSTICKNQTKISTLPLFCLFFLIVFLYVFQNSCKWKCVSIFEIIIYINILCSVLDFFLCHCICITKFFVINIFMYGKVYCSTIDVLFNMNIIHISGWHGIEYDEHWIYMWISRNFSIMIWFHCLAIFIRIFCLLLDFEILICVR